MSSVMWSLVRYGSSSLDGLGRVLASDLLQPLGEAARVRLLSLGQRLEPLGQLGETVVAGGFGKARVHLRVLVRLARDGRLEVRLGLTEGLPRSRVTDILQKVHVPESVAGLGVGRVLEEAGHVREALDVRHAGEVEGPAGGPRA